jgi:hypothetical protein
MFFVQGKARLFQRILIAQGISFPEGNGTASGSGYSDCR